MVWELVEGVDLLDLLNAAGGRISESRARRYFRQLLSGVKYIHNNGRACHLAASIRAGWLTRPAPPLPAHASPAYLQ